MEEDNQKKLRSALCCSMFGEHALGQWWEIIITKWTVIISRCGQRRMRLVYSISSSFSIYRGRGPWCSSSARWKFKARQSNVEHEKERKQSRERETGKCCTLISSLHRLLILLVILNENISIPLVEATHLQDCITRATFTLQPI